ncbi:unnamed protein product [Parascedosporium putredinis]|uniref:Uncharacterized protein n=1 Tax=Parascedosporium putredinis TaxID=1442378 RepID=A0A9P1GWT5_9PEZI|nr:unnamed protein product [Parascedosporium putredinis]CAI7989893.1 unnamed protein product [Parascedosporium putredinis]
MTKLAHNSAESENNTQWPDPNARQLDQHENIHVNLSDPHESLKMSLVNRKNNVPDLQRMYQAAYAQHTRIWKINPRAAASLYGMGRKAAGYNTWFSSN